MYWRAPRLALVATWVIQSLQNKYVYIGWLMKGTRGKGLVGLRVSLVIICRRILISSNLNINRVDEFNKSEKIF